MLLSDVLRDPTVLEADPLVLAGAADLDRPVSWVHTSEVLDIAPLLRGGELLLVGGVSLGAVSAEVRRDYIHELAAAGAAGLALETGVSISAVPEEMIAEAERLNFPLIELRRVVRFVEVTQAVNGLLVNESVRRLQLADRIGHALAAELAGGGSTADLVSVLARETGADCMLATVTGERLAQAQPEDTTAPQGSAAELSCAITSAGVTVAVLTMAPRSGTDLLVLDAAADRAPEALGLSLLRSRPLTRIERDTHEFLALAGKESRPGQRFAELAQRLGIAGGPAFVCVIARFDQQISTSGLDAALRRGNRTLIARMSGDTFQAVVTLGPGVLAAVRSALIADLRATSLPPGIRVAVGTGAHAVAGIAGCLRTATLSIELDGQGQTVLDAADVAVERLLTAIGSSDRGRRFHHRTDR